MKQKTVCVVGSGYVGLPLANAFVMEKKNKSVESALIRVLKEFLYMIQMKIAIILGTRSGIMKMSLIYLSLSEKLFYRESIIINMMKT